MDTYTPPPPGNVSVDPDLLEQARALKVDVTGACERGLKAQIDKAQREQQWLAENAAAIASWNAYVEEHGLPLADISVY